MINCTNVGFAYDEHLIFSDINLSIAKGEFVYIVGETGCGKTTLMRLLYMDILPTAGIVRVDSFSSNSIKRRKLHRLRRKLGIIFQDYKLLDDRSVYDNVTFVLQAVPLSWDTRHEDACDTSTDSSRIDSQEEFSGRRTFGRRATETCPSRELS